MEKLTLQSIDFVTAEVGPIYSIESQFIRKKLENHGGCFDEPLRIPVLGHILRMALYYCKKRAKIKLQHHDDVVDQHLENFDSEFLQHLRLDPDYCLVLDLFDAAVRLNVKSLYDLIIDDVVYICDHLTTKRILKQFHMARNYPHENIWNFSWAFLINATRI